MRGVLVSGVQLRASRIHRGFTQEQLASQTDLDVKTIRKAENSKRIDLETLKRIATTLGQELNHLIQPTGSEAELQARRQEVVWRWNRCWDEHDLAALVAHYHDDATMTLPGGPNIPFAGTFQGREEIACAFRLAWESCRTVTSRQGEITLLVCGDVVLLQGIKGVYLPNGEVAWLWCVQIFTLEGDLIREHRVDYDTLQFVHLLEFPNPGGPGTPNVATPNPPNQLPTDPHRPDLIEIDPARSNPTS